MAKDHVRLFAKMDVENALTDVRFVSAGPVGFTLFWKGVAHSKLNLADGFVPKDAPALLCPGVSSKEIDRGVKALLACGLWTTVGGGYVTPPGWWQSEQVTAEQVTAKRQKDADRKALERERRRHEKERLASLESQGSHEGVTRDIGRDSRESHAGVTGLSREGTEYRVQSTELPSGSSAAAPAPTQLKAGWEPLGDWVDHPALSARLSAIEGRRSPEIRQASRRQSQLVREVCGTNRMGPDDLAAVLAHPDASDWRGLDPEAVVRVWRLVQAERSVTRNPDAIPAAGGATSEAELARIEAMVSR